jgi:tetratricopeptide (TPR) repeat protein
MVLKTLFVLLMLIPSVSFAVDCSRPPTGFGGSWARQYKDWCESCCGKYYPSGPRCDPGSNWGCRQQQGPTYTPQPSYDYEAERQRQLEAERQRQREIEEQRKREDEEAKQRQQEFERKKQEALSSMKGITESELGLKGVGTGELGLKDIGDTTTAKKLDCEWGNMGSSVVDLRCLGLDPDKPIVIDSHVVRGEERVFPAQIDPATFENANYNKGFEALMRFDAASAAAAVAYFKQAQLERPRDPLVRNALLLAQDILKARQQKEKDDQFWSANFTLRGYAALMMGDNEKAKGYIAQARKLDPNNDEVKFVESLAKVDLGPESTHPGRKNAYRFVANSLVSISKRDIPAAISMLEAAQRLQPGDKLIGTLLLEMRNYETGRASANTGK